MESFWNWKWLMRANARALFFIALLILLLVLGWCVWVVWKPLNPAHTETTHTTQPAPRTEMTLGLLTCLSNELDVGAQIVSINPFRPTLESLAANREPMSNVLQRVRVTRGGTNDDPFATLRTHRSVPVKKVAPQIPVLTYLGYFQRPDGKTAALFRDSTSQTTTFHLSGDIFHGIALLVTGTTRARVRLPDGQERDLAIGDSFELPAEAQP